ncbi:MAG: hypothetical protein ACE5HI_10540 [bacterium]
MKKESVVILNQKEINKFFDELVLSGNSTKDEFIAWNLLTKAKDLWRLTSLLKSVHDKEEKEKGTKKSQL